MEDASHDRKAASSASPGGDVVARPSADRGGLAPRKISPEAEAKALADPDTARRKAAKWTALAAATDGEALRSGEPAPKGAGERPRLRAVEAPVPQEPAASPKPAPASKPERKPSPKSVAKPEPAPRKPAVEAKPDPPPVAPPAVRASRRGRHTLLLASFLLLVLVPTTLTATYLYVRAADQYASTMGFAVRTEEMGSAFDVLGGITNLGGSSSSDTDILYEFIQGQQIVREIDEALDLRAMYTRHWEDDPVFSLSPDATIEDLLDHWHRKVRIAYDAGTGLIEIQALAFEPEEAHAIARAVFERSSEMINELSAIAREDATRYAREELEIAVERLKDAREAMSAFRSRTQMVDPNADLQGQMGLLNTLQSQLAESLIELDLVRETARESDPRIAQAERRIAVIKRRIDEERGKFSIGGAASEREDYVLVLAEFDRLDVDLHFAREAYVAALAAFDEAQAEAQRKSRYLAAYVEPTMPQSSEHPRRIMLTALTGLFLLLAWSILALVYYSIRDRR